MAETISLQRDELLQGGKRRRRRQQAVRVTLYVLFVAAVLSLGLFTDWPRIQESFVNVELALGMFPEVVTIAAKNTLLYTATAYSFGLMLGLVLALMKLSTVRPYRWIASIYIEVFRGLPALLTIFLIAFGLPLALGVRIPFGVLGRVTLGLGLVAAAYVAEVIRAGIEAVPKGQLEAARSLGMSHGRAMTTIVIPQAFRIIIPPLTNELVLLIKDTSLIFVIGTTPLTKELTKFGRDLMAETFNATPLILVGLVYLAITIPLTRLVALLEQRAARAR